MKKLLLFSVFVLSGLSHLAAMKPRLDEFKHTGAWILPVTSYFSEKEGKEVDYIMLAQDKDSTNLFDAFGGAAEADDTHPAQTIAREFSRAVLTHHTLYKDEKKLLKHMDLMMSNTELVLAIEDLEHCSKDVLYFTRFSQNGIQMIRKHFAGILRNKEEQTWEKKHRVALVRLDLLVQKIRSSARDTDVRVAASITDQQGNTTGGKINLSPALVRMLKKYCKKNNYRLGRSKRVRFYKTLKCKL